MKEEHKTKSIALYVQQFEFNQAFNKAYHELLKKSQVSELVPDPLIPFTHPPNVKLQSRSLIGKQPLPPAAGLLPPNWRRFYAYGGDGGDVYKELIDRHGKLTRSRSQYCNHVCIN